MALWLFYIDNAKRRKNQRDAETTGISNVSSPEEYFQIAKNNDNLQDNDSDNITKIMD